MTAAMLGTSRTGDVVGVIMTTVVEVAATMIVVGITTGIGTVGVMMTESGGTERCFKARNQ